MDNKFSFIFHINHVEEKVNRIINSLRKFTAYNWGLISKHPQQIYITAIERIIIYSPPIWYKKQVAMRKKLRVIQRKSFIKVTKALKRVSNPA